MFEKSINLLIKVDMPYHIAWSYFDFGLIYLFKNDQRNAKINLQKSMEIYLKLGMDQEVKKIEKEMANLQGSSGK
jgi:hypothetical protein